MTGCGGGGGGVTSNGIQISTLTPAYFQVVPNAINVTYPTNTEGNITATAIDINGDGLLDLVNHYIGSYGQTYNGSAPSPNAIQILIQKPDGTFEDQTSTYLIGTNNLGGDSRKMKVVDINGDGKPDILYAINQEDGRIETTPANMVAQMAALISVGNQYKVVNFGALDWYHSVGFGMDSQGKYYATGSGFVNKANTTSTDAYYIDSQGIVQKSSTPLPFLSSLSFEIFNSSGLNLVGNKLIQTNADPLNFNNGIMDGYLLTANNSWSKIQSLTLFPQVGNVNLTDTNGNITDTQPVFNANGNYIVYAGSTESCKIKLSLTSDLITIFKFTGFKLTNYKLGDISTPATSIQAFSILKGLTITNGAVQEVPLNISGEQTDNINSNFFDCNDINGDGYADIVVYPYNSNGFPFVYINNKQMGFSYAGLQNMPNDNQLYAQTNAVTSIFKDMNGDGIADLIIFPGNPFISTGIVSYIYEKGIKFFN
jgi:hypothetical protein